MIIVIEKGLILNRVSTWGEEKNFTSQSFWARGYYVSTVGKDEETVRNYIKHQEEEDKKIEQLNLF